MRPTRVFWQELKTIVLREIGTKGPESDGFNKKNIGHQARDCFCDILAKDVAALGYCPENLPEDKLKGNGLISLVEEISVQPNIDTQYKVKEHQEVKDGVQTRLVMKT